MRDAITVCQGLGIRYFWIDALCIIQDGEAGWQRESARMLDVYASSHITIAAHSAASCHDGFLGKQALCQPRWQRSIQVDIDESKYLEFFLSEEKEHWSPSPLMDRGWTLQEDILSRRIIHYTGKELL